MHVCESELIPYTKSHIFKPRFLIVKINDNFGVIDINGRMIIPPIYQSIEPVMGEELNVAFYIVKQQDMLGVCDLYGKILIPIQYKRISPGNDYYCWKYDYDHRKASSYFKTYSSYPTYYQWNWGMVPLHLKGQEMFFDVEAKDGTKKRLLSSGKEAFYLFFDTETTGLPNNYDAPSSDVKNWPRLVQLSWILTDDSFNILSEHDYIIYPDDFSIPESASNLHGITTSIAQEKGTPLRGVLEKFNLAFSEAKVVVGHNISFDKKIIGAEMVRLDFRDIMDDKQSICTMRTTADFCKIPGNRRYKWPTLQELHKTLFGCEFADAHNAMCDVKATLKCFKKLKQKGVLDDCLNSSSFFSCMSDEEMEELARLFA